MKKSDELKILVMGYWRFNRNCHIVASEYNYGDADVISVTPAGMVIETEVKVSLSDLKREVNKSKHLAMQSEFAFSEGHELDHPYIRSAPRRHYFYFAVPQALKEKAKVIIAQEYPYAGLLVVKPIDPEVNTCYSIPVYSVRTARQFKSKPKLTYEQTMEVAKGMATTLCKLGIKLIEKGGKS